MRENFDGGHVCWDDKDIVRVTHCFLAFVHEQETRCERTLRGGTCVGTTKTSCVVAPLGQ